MGSPARSAATYETSTAWRFLYHPQVGHTTCGNLADWQLGQTLRGGTSSVQLLARLLRVLAFDVFFLGTAMA